MREPRLETADLADQYRRIYRAKFKADVAAADKIPFIFHLCFWGIFIIPILYLSIPHKRRPWLYKARWLVLAVCVALNIWMIRTVRSANFAFSYGAGLCAAWGTVWNFTMLVWTRPQWDAKRVERYPRHAFEERLHHCNGNLGQSTAASASAVVTNGQSSNGHTELRSRGQQQSKATHLEEDMTGAGAEQERKIPDYIGEIEPCKKSNGSSSDIQEMNKREPFVYEWQEFPENASFLKRLDWAFDIGTTMRLTGKSLLTGQSSMMLNQSGWNWAIHVLPPYRPPPWLDEEKTSQVSLDSLPDRTAQGYSRCHSLKQFLLERLSYGIIPCYLIIDVLATFMTQDPYFILGPNDLPLPHKLAAMNPFVLSLRRTFFSFVAVIVALRLAWDFGAVLIALLGPPVLGFRAHPWHLPSMTGSFTQVLDRGLSGFWGSWWHQTFRFGFSAPTKWLIHNGYVKEKSTAATVVGALVAFVTSGFLHGTGSYTTIPETNVWGPPTFFFLSGVGTSLQSTLSKRLKKQIEKQPRWVRRAGNLLFTMIWLHISSKFLLDDFGRCGIWLWEPVPFSLTRALGYGIKGDTWSRWGPDDNPHWITMKHWWQSGVGI